MTSASQLSLSLRLCGLSAAFLIFSDSVNAESGLTPLRIYHSPYSSVDWSSTLRIKAEHHDHNGARVANIRAYDAAGYQALSLMDYSGAPALAYAMRRALWPPEEFGLTNDFMKALQNIKLFIPNAEEVGLPAYHMTAPFMTTFLENAPLTTPKVELKGTQFQSPQDLIDIISKFGGLPIIAHPWNDPTSYATLRGFRGIEIYSAYAETKKRLNDPDFTTIDRAGRLINYWDGLLRTNQAILGIAVNDHFGPDAAVNTTEVHARDSGKIVVFGRTMTLADYRDAFEHGALIAVKDIGEVKDRYPALNSLTITDSSIEIETDGAVSWISNGQTVGAGAHLDFQNIPPGATYLRGEISNPEGSIVYTQAFAVRPVGDANGDGAVNAADRRVCKNVALGLDKDADHVAACNRGL